MRKQSLRETAARVSRAIFQDEGSRYRKWVELYDTISPQEAEEFVASWQGSLSNRNSPFLCPSTRRRQRSSPTPLAKRTELDAVGN